MLSSEKQALLREMWNNRFNIHSLRPLQSKVTQVSEDLGILKFFVEHQCVPTPLPVEFGKPVNEKRKRQLKFRPLSISATLQERQIRSLSIASHLPVEEALIQRLKQHGIIIQELTVERLTDRKPSYLVKVLKSPYVTTTGDVKLQLYVTAEDLLATEFLDGEYNSRSKLLRLLPTSYPSLTSDDGRYFYGSMVSWQRHSDYLKVKLMDDTHLNLYGALVGDLNEYKNHLDLLKTEPFLSKEFKSGEHFELKFNENETLFIYAGETISLPKCDKRIAIGVTTTEIVARDFKLEITSTEQI